MCFSTINHYPCGHIDIITTHCDACPAESRLYNSPCSRHPPQSKDCEYMCDECDEEGSIGQASRPNSVAIYSSSSTTTTSVPRSVAGSASANQGERKKAVESSSRPNPSSRASSSTTSARRDPAVRVPFPPRTSSLNAVSVPYVLAENREGVASSSRSNISDRARIPAPMGGSDVRVGGARWLVGDSTTCGEHRGFAPNSFAVRFWEACGGIDVPCAAHRGVEASTLTRRRCVVCQAMRN